MRLKQYAREYVATGGVKAEAARRLGHKGNSRTLSVTGNRLHHEAEAAGVLAQVVEQAEAKDRMKVDEVLERLSKQARADLGQHLEWDGDSKRPRIRISREHTETLRELTERTGPLGEDGNPLWSELKIKVTDPRPALEALARIYGIDDGGISDRAPAQMRTYFLLLLQQPETRQKLLDLSRQVAAMESEE